VTPHPDVAALDVPAAMSLGPYHLAMLTGADLDEDFATVTRSALVLQGLFDEVWPEGLTREDDLLDLCWHHREFTLRRSFAWVIRDAGGVYLGCAYLFPDIGARGRAEAVYWIADMPERHAHLSDFGELYRGWLTTLLPTPFEIAFKCNAHLWNARAAQG